ncbi:MAG: GTP cyclohydrolase I, partial [Chloroflexi bacterium]|nr:GTP cyclohydrolase I [Chloroflexota bacterium]
FSRRLQLQERLTNQIAEAIQEKLSPEGVAVATQAYHLCMMMRGVEQTNAYVLNTVMLGRYETDRVLRKEFLDGLPDARR